MKKPAGQFWNKLSEDLFGFGLGHNYQYQANPRRIKLGKATYPFDLVYLGLIPLLMLVLIVRKPDSLLYPQFYAEDGTLFFSQNLLQGFWKTLFDLELSRGFPYLLQRLVAQLVRPFGVGAAPLLYNLTGIVVAAAVGAFFSLSHFRHIVRNDYLRIVFCFLAVSVPNSHEMIGNLANVSWYLGIWAILATVMPLPASRRGVGVLLLVWLVTIFSSPLTFILAPLWLLRLALARRAGRYREAAFALFVLGLAGVIIALTRNLGAGTIGAATNRPASALPDPAALVNLIATRIFTEGLIGSPLTEFLRTTLGYGIVYLVAGLAVLGLVGASWLTRFQAWPVLLYSAYILIGSIVAMLVGRSSLNEVGMRLESIYLVGAGRYFVAGILMIYLLSLATVNRLPALPRWQVRSTLVSLALLVLVGIIPGFLVPAFSNLNWPQYAARLETKLATGSRQPLNIPINPPGWFLAFDRRLVSPEVQVPAQVALGELVANTEFSQTFVSRCANLSAVEVFLATFQRRNQVQVIFQLVEPGSGRILHEQSLTGSTIADNAWQEFDFTPQSDSQNKVYLFRLRSPDGQPGNAVTVWASRQDNYWPGQASVNNTGLGGDLVFRYSCS